MSVVTINCSKSVTEKESQSAATTDTLSFSDSYQPPAFTDARRIQKIETVLPEVEAVFESFAEENHLPGYVFGLVVGDSLVFSKSNGTINRSSNEPASVESGFHIASMTKSFTAMAVVKLRDEDKLSLDDPVSKYIPELGLTYLTKDTPPITIENLLTMTSGLPEDNPWADRQLDDSNEEFINFLSEGITFSNAPFQYEYSNLGFAMLGTIITRVAEMPYQQYITDQILEPLGMKHTYWEYAEVPETQLAHGYRWEEEKFKKEPMLHTGAFGAIGGLITSLNDFSKYVAFHLSAYPARNEAEAGPVKRSSLREMHKFTAPRLYTEATNAANELCPAMMGYGYGLRVKKDCNGLLSVGHSGGLPGFGSNYVFYPTYGIGIIAFSNRTYAPAYAVNERAMAVIFDRIDLKPRELSVSEILKSRTKEVIELIQTWDEQLGDQILANNFYLDKSRKLRMKQANETMELAGQILSIEPITPLNQLRGTFIMHGEKADIKVFFSMSPERVPKIQALRLWIVENSISK